MAFGPVHKDHDECGSGSFHSDPERFYQWGHFGTSVYRARRLLYSGCSTSNGCVSASDAGKTSLTVSARCHALFVIFSRTSFTWVTYATPRSPIKKLRIVLQMALGMGSRNARTCLAPTNRQTCGGAQVHLHGPGQGSGEDSGKQQT